MTINNRAIYTHKFIVVYTFEENSAVVLLGFAFHYFYHHILGMESGDPTRAKWIQRNHTCWDERRTRRTLTHSLRETQGGAAGLVTRGRATAAWRGRTAWLGPPSPGEEHLDVQEQRP